MKRIPGRVSSILGLMLLFVVSGCSTAPPVPGLHQMILKGDVAGAMRLIERREDINASNERGVTALHLAVVRNRADLVEALLAAGANLESRTNRGDTPLILACRIKSSAIAKLLVERGARIEPAYKGTNALSEAILHNHHDLVLLFISRGANLEVRNHFGETPLFYAVQFGSAESIRFLVKSGAAVNAVAEDGRMVLHVAAMKLPGERAAAIDLLLQLGAEVRDADGGEVALFSTALLHQYLADAALSRGDTQSGLSHLKKSALHYSKAASKFEQVASSHEATAAQIQRYNTLSGVLASLSAFGQAHTQASTMAQVTPRGQTVRGYGVGIAPITSPAAYQALQARYRALAETCKSSQAQIVSLVSCIEKAPGNLSTCRRMKP